MLGRFKHEGANVAIARNGKVVAYMGDDERGDYIYKFVSRKTFDGRRGMSATTTQPHAADGRHALRGSFHRRRHQ